MTIRRIVLAGFLGTMAAACGGQSPADGQSSANAACDPNGEVPCFAGVAEPCTNIHSGYDGDDYCRAAPKPSDGFQIHVGPKDYTNPDDVAKYLAKPGDETNWAEVVQTPNDATVYWDGYYSFMRPGSHHFILFGLPAG